MDRHVQREKARVLVSTRSLTTHLTPPCIRCWWDAPVRYRGFPRGDPLMEQATEVGCHRPSPAKGQGTAGAVAASADHRLREANGRIGSTHVGDRFHSSCPRCRRSSRSPSGRGRNCEDCPSPWMGQADVGTSREAMAWRECCRAHRDLGLRRPLGCIELAQRGCSAAHGASTDYGAPVTDGLSGRCDYPLVASSVAARERG